MSPDVEYLCMTVALKVDSAEYIITVLKMLLARSDCDEIVLCWRSVGLHDPHTCKSATEKKL